MGRERDASFYDERYARQPKRARTIAYRRHLAVAEYIVGKSVLDLGCGVGLIANMVDGREYVGVDFSEEAIASSRRICDNDNATFMIGDVMTFEPERTYDTVLLIELLEHLSQPRVVVERALKACSKRLIVTVPRDMRAPSHVKQMWTRHDITDLVGPLACCTLFGGPDQDWWWLAIRDMEGL